MRTSSAISNNAVTLKVLTFNIWGIPFISQDYSERMQAIGTKIAEGEYDIICLQEVWNKCDFTSIYDKVKTIYRHAHYFFSGVFGSGICVFSKWPMNEVLFHKWQVNGYIHRIFHGDWFGGKGVGLCKLNVNGFIVNVYTCHLHAQYNCDNDEYIAHRVVQAYDTAQFIKTTSNDADLTILAGDLNSDANEICYDIIHQYVNLKDAFMENVEFIGTYDCERNSYANQQHVRKEPHGKRIDHILYKPGKGYKVKCIHYGNPFESRIPGYSFSYSDHEAITATFVLSSETFSNDGDYNDDTDDSRSLLKTFEKCLEIFKEAFEVLKKDKLKYKVGAFICLLLLIGLWAVILFFSLNVGNELDLPLFFKLNDTLRISVIIVVSFLCFCTEILLLFFVLMAFLWNRIEYCGIISSSNSMKISLNSIFVPFLNGKQNDAGMQLVDLSNDSSS